MDKTENKIRKAFENATPDVYEKVMTEGYYEKGIVLPLEKKSFGNYMLRRVLSRFITLVIVVLIVVALIVIFMNVGGLPIGIWPFTA